LNVFTPELPLIADITGCDDQIVDCGRRSNRCLLEEVFRLSTYKARPDAVLGHDLRPLAQAGFGKLIESSFGLLYRPDFHQVEFRKTAN
jgi:hypothetical protein